MEIIEDVLADIENKLRSRLSYYDNEYVERRAKEMLSHVLLELVDKEYF